MLLLARLIEMINITSVVMIQQLLQLIYANNTIHDNKIENVINLCSVLMWLVTMVISRIFTLIHFLFRFHGMLHLTFFTTYATTITLTIFIDVSIVLLLSVFKMMIRITLAVTNDDGWMDMSLGLRDYVNSEDEDTKDKSCYIHAAFQGFHSALDLVSGENDENCDIVTKAYEISHTETHQMVVK